MTNTETLKRKSNESAEKSAADIVQAILDRIPDGVDEASGMLPPECYTSPTLAPGRNALERDAEASKADGRLRRAYSGH